MIEGLGAELLVLATGVCLGILETWRRLEVAAPSAPPAQHDLQNPDSCPLCYAGRTRQDWFPDPKPKVQPQAVPPRYTPFDRLTSRERLARDLAEEELRARLDAAADERRRKRVAAPFMGPEE